jgi:hypothetical protein
VSLVAAMRGREAKVGLSVVALLAVAAFAVAPLLADPNASDFSLAPAADGGPPGSSARHWLGVDPLYRDELARLLSGGRISLLVASIATLVACAIGVAVGVAAAGLKKGGARWADGLLMRGVDVLLAFPFLLLVTLVGVLVPRSGLGTLVLVLGLTGWTGVARVVRARAAVVLEQDFVLAARAMGGWAALDRRPPRAAQRARDGGRARREPRRLDDPRRGRPRVPHRGAGPSRCVVGAHAAGGGVVHRPPPDARRAAGGLHPRRDARLPPARRGPAARQR